MDNTQVDYAEDIDIVIPKYNLIEYSSTNSKTSGSLWQYKKDEPALEGNDNIIDFPANNNNNNSFELKQQIAGQTGNGGTKDVEIMVPLKYLSNFWRTVEMLLINCEISFQLKWSKNCIIVTVTAANQNPRFQIDDTELYVPVITLSTQDNVKLLKQLESVFKRIINWSKYLAKTTNQGQNNLYIFQLSLFSRSKYTFCFFI